MENSFNSDNSSELSYVNNVPNLRKRKPYINCNKTQKWKNKEIIASHSTELSHFCRSMGLIINIKSNI